MSAETEITWSSLPQNLEITKAARIKMCFSQT